MHVLEIARKGAGHVCKFEFGNCLSEDEARQRFRDVVRKDKPRFFAVPFAFFKSSGLLRTGSSSIFRSSI